MKNQKNFDLHKFFVISAIAIGIGFFLTSLILSRMVFNEKGGDIFKEDIQAPKEAQRVAQLSSGKSQMPDEKNGAVVASSEEDNAEISTEAEASQVPQADTSGETPLNYEEKLRQRWRNFTKTPEYKEYSRKFSELARKSNEASAPIEAATIKWNEYLMNPYSVFGLTKAEGEKTKWSEEGLEFMEKEGKKLKQQLDESVNLQRETLQQMRDLVQWTKDLVGMTDEEYYIAIGRPPLPPPIPKKDAHLIR